MVIERRSFKLTVAPLDACYVDVVVELDPNDASRDRVKGVRVRLARPEDARWDQLEELFGSFAEVAEYMDAPKMPPTRVGAKTPERSLPHTIRIGVDEEGKITSFVIR